MIYNKNSKLYFFNVTKTYTDKSTKNMVDTINNKLKVLR